MNIVLHEPEIPFNTGNIGRTCLAANATLHLIRPYGFLLNERNLKRAGLDYWHQLCLREYDSFDDFLLQNVGATVYMASTKAPRHYAQIRYQPDDFVMFGKESAGIPEEILLRYPDKAVRIPMADGCRSLNLSCSVAIILYEAMRQQDFSGLLSEGRLHRLQWPGS